MTCRSLKKEVIYTVVYEKKTLFTKRVEIEAYCMKTIQDFHRELRADHSK